MPLLSKDLDCEHAVALVAEYLDGALTRRRRRRFEAHLRACPNCRAYLEQIRITIASTGRIVPEALDAEVRDELVELFRRYHRK